MQLADPTQPGHPEVGNAQGRAVQRREWKPGNAALAVPAEALEPGAYAVRLILKIPALPSCAW